MIKPCPFCGSTELEVGTSTEDREGIPAHIYCADCGCCGPWDYVKDSSVLDNIEAVVQITEWNNRKP